MSSRSIAKRIAEAMLSKKGYDIVIMDVRKLTTATDFFVLCSADSDTQVKAIADEVRDGAESIGASPWHSEGYHALSWVLIDFVDVVAHVFHRHARDYYSIERLWADAETTHVQDEAEPQPAARVKRPRVMSSRRTRQFRGKGREETT